MALVVVPNVTTSYNVLSLMSLSPLQQSKQMDLTALLFAVNVALIS